LLQRWARHKRDGVEPMGWGTFSVQPNVFNSRAIIGTACGDQGIFVTAEAYESCGQHSPWPLFEEIELIRRLRRCGPFECVGEGVEVDARRWQQDGWWSRSFQNRLLALAHVMGMPATRLAEFYRARKAAKNTHGL
jgi:hypothetical protein